jgi:NmrA-like family
MTDQYEYDEQQQQQRSKAAFDMKIALNAEIQSLCYPDDDELTSVIHAPVSTTPFATTNTIPGSNHGVATTSSTPVPSTAPVTSTQKQYNNDYSAPSASSYEPVKAKISSIANKTVTEWNIGTSNGDDGDNGDNGGGLLEIWPSHLPRPPSMRRIKENENDTIPIADKSSPAVIVFNANTQEGSSMVRVLSEKGLRVVAVVRVATSRNTKQLVKLKNVTVRVADLNNHDAVVSASNGCCQAFLVTKYWERFENFLEEDMAKVVLKGSAEAGIKRLIFATFEDTIELRLRNRKSQIIPTKDGRIYPKFDTSMTSIIDMAKTLGVSVTNMMTSYLDEPTCKKSLILIRNEQGKIITQPFIQEITPPPSSTAQQQQAPAPTVSVVG